MICSEGESKFQRHISGGKQIIMKVRLLIAGVFLFACVPGSRSQTGFRHRTADERAKADIDKIAGPLALTSGQKTTVMAIYTDYYTDIDKVGGGLQGRAGRNEVNEKFISAREQRLKRILTEEQYIKYKEVVEPALQKAAKRTVNY